MSTGTRALTRAAAVAFVVSVATAAGATDGYFQYGYGARQKALGGAGVADGRDATSASLNPAGLVHAPQELNVSGTLFSPLRSETGSGQPGFTPSGEVDSRLNDFVIPNFGLTYRNIGLPFSDVIGISVSGNGGMNTHYPALTRTSPPCPPGGTGVFCAGIAGVDFQQAFLSVAVAKTLAPGLSIGVAPIVARQQIKLQGLAPFGQFSADPAHVSDNGTDIAWGAGVRAGIEWAVAPNIRLGLAGNSEIYNQKFDRYSGIFAEQGRFNVPPSLQAGIAIDVTPGVTLLADYRRIWYGAIASIANPSTNQAPLGSDNGPGFGWSDIDILKIGAEWRATSDLTLRAGYSYNTSPISSRDVQLNIIAPAVVQHHITGGLEYRWRPDVSIELAGAYVPEGTVSGSEIIGNPAHGIELSMHQWEATLGVKYYFGGEPAPLK